MNDLPKELFASEEIHPREIRLRDGKLHTLHFKKVSFFERQRFHKAHTSSDESQQELAPFRLIASALVDADGKQLLTLDQAINLDPDAVLPIVNVIVELMTPSEQEKKE